MIKWFRKFAYSILLPEAMKEECIQAKNPRPVVRFSDTVWICTYSFCMQNYSEGPCGSLYGYDSEF